MERDDRSRPVERYSRRETTIGRTLGAREGGSIVVVERGRGG